MDIASTLMFALPGNESMADTLAARLGAERGAMSVRRFPDGESYVRLASDVSGRDVSFVATLDRPDDKILALTFALETARELGASRVGLVVPYLGYMRQDKRFQAGEAITSRIFARLLSGAVNWLVTVDPHLHRFHDMSELYAVRTHVVHAAPAIAGWISEHVERPIIVGPDEESEQWVADIASRAGAQYVTLRKVRHGDRDVEVSAPAMEVFQNATPILVDDIISTGRTMIAIVKHLNAHGARPPVCIGIHAIFADDAYETLKKSGAGTIATCNTVPHVSNLIDISALLTESVRIAAVPSENSSVAKGDKTG